MRSLREGRIELVVTELILAELHLHLLRSFGSRVAREYLAAVKFDPLVSEVFTDPDLQRSALSDWLERFRDQSFSLTDAVSFAVMSARGIRTAFTFDRDFAVAGFDVLPGAPR